MDALVDFAVSQMKSEIDTAQGIHPTSGIPVEGLWSLFIYGLLQSGVPFTLLENPWIKIFFDQILGPCPSANVAYAKYVADIEEEVNKYVRLDFRKMFH
jgi:hypothetical protein